MIDAILRRVNSMNAATVNVNYEVRGRLRASHFLPHLTNVYSARVPTARFISRSGPLVAYTLASAAVCRGAFASISRTHRARVPRLSMSLYRPDSRPVATIRASAIHRNVTPAPSTTRVCVAWAPVCLSLGFKR